MEQRNARSDNTAVTGDTGPFRQAADDVFELVTIALNQTSFSGLTELLPILVRAVGGCGCVIWQVPPDATIREGGKDNRLFAVAEWFEGGFTVVPPDLPSSSVTARAVLLGETIRIDDLRADEGLYRAEPFLSGRYITAMCSVPLTFLDGVKGALNVYRNDSLGFSLTEILLIEKLAQLLPALYQAIQDKVGLNLLHAVDEWIHRSELSSMEIEDAVGQPDAIIQGICDLLSQTLHCIEASIFLESNVPQQYVLVGTTSPSPLRKTTFGKEDAGLTSWVLRQGQPIWIYDLRSLDRFRSALQRDYPGLVPSDNVEILTQADELLGLDMTQPGPPAGCIVVPILARRHVIGAIRCRTVDVAPHSFNSGDLKLLRLVAGRLSQSWTLSRRHAEVEEANRSWRELVEVTIAMNQVALRELTQDLPDEQRIFAEGLRVAQRTIPTATAADIRLLDGSTRELYFAQIAGPIGDASGLFDLNRQKSKRFTTEKRLDSAGAHVVASGKTYVIPDVAADPYVSPIFPDTKSMIVAPIGSQNEILGVLDIHWMGREGIPSSAPSVATLLAQQLGLYYQLSQVIRRLVQARAEIDESARRQTQVYEDLQHQLQTPLNQAYRWVLAALRETDSNKVRADLVVMRGLFGKAKRVGMNVRLFVDLAKDGLVRTELSLVKGHDLIKILIAAATDAEFFVDPARNIKFVVDTESIERACQHPLNTDLRLLEQAMSNLLDNAAKYSFSNTVVQIRGGLSGTHRFHISVSNQGLTLTREEVKHSVERGWRSETAMKTTGEGSGIGLWVVHNIMRALGGELVVTPTDDRGFTCMKLVF